MKVSVVVRTTKGCAQRKACKFAFERLLHEREYNSDHQTLFFSFWEGTTFDWPISKKKIGTLDVPQDHEAFGVFKGSMQQSLLLLHNLGAFQERDFGQSTLELKGF